MNNKPVANARNGIENRSAGIRKNTFQVSPVDLRSPSARQAQDRLSVIFRKILLDLCLTELGRFDCELARFSGDLRVKHRQDMRFIKGTKEKKITRAKCVTRPIVIPEKAGNEVTAGQSMA